MSLSLYTECSFHLGYWFTFILYWMDRQYYCPSRDYTECWFMGVSKAVLHNLLFLLNVNDLPGFVEVQGWLFADNCLVYHPIHREVNQVMLQHNWSVCTRAEGKYMKHQPILRTQLTPHPHPTPTPTPTHPCQQYKSQIQPWFLETKSKETSLLIRRVC